MRYKPEWISTQAKHNYNHTQYIYETIRAVNRLKVLIKPTTTRADDEWIKLIQIML